MGMAVPTYYSADMVRALPDDGNRYETVHGELLVTPAPRMWHQLVLGRLQLTLGNYLVRHPVGLLLAWPADISWSADTLVQPDLFVAELAEARTLDWTNVQPLHLVVEVLSPTTARHDRFTKRRLYQEVRIPIYWIVDPDRQEVEVWTPDSEFPIVERERIRWSPDGDVEALDISLRDLFRSI